MTGMDETVRRGGPIYEVIGKYRINASDAEKVVGCCEALNEAACRLVTLRVPLADVGEALDHAFALAEEEHMEISQRGGWS